ncbi:membrane protein required for colicin V production [Orenia marismortui]|uniref:Membrane protein required for colicin V production n=1 Tax=Orenia marismortui TaxID=46469 RepID=A0A4R8GXR9_9FIRM|nr:membrane protein required for colicin V production [Orenia marismortui]
MKNFWNWLRKETLISLDFNLLDLIIIILSLIFMVKGYKIGLIRQFTAILAIVIGIYIAQEQYKIIGDLIFNKFDLSRQIAEFISFIIIILIVTLIINLLGYFIIQMLDIMFLSFIDSFGGLLFGFIKGLLILYIALIVLNKLPFDLIEKQINKSYFAPKILSFSTLIDDKIKDISR